MIKISCIASTFFNELHHPSVCSRQATSFMSMLPGHANAAFLSANRKSHPSGAVSSLIVMDWIYIALSQVLIVLYIVSGCLNSSTMCRTHLSATADHLISRCQRTENKHTICPWKSSSALTWKKKSDL